MFPTRDGIGPSGVGCPRPGRGSSTFWRTLSRRVGARVGAAHAARRSGGFQRPVGWPDNLISPQALGQRLYYYRSLALGAAQSGRRAGALRRRVDLWPTNRTFFRSPPGGKHLHETLLVRLRRRSVATHAHALHWLDRETAGLVLLARQPATRGPTKPGLRGAK